MTMPIRHSAADSWLAGIFSAQAALKGGVVRRSVAWVDREIGRERFELEVRRRGFHMIECGGQFVVLCSAGPLRLIC